MLADEVRGTEKAPVGAAAQGAGRWSRCFLDVGSVFLPSSFCFCCALSRKQTWQEAAPSSPPPGRPLTRLVKTALSCFWAPALLSHRLLPCVPGWALPRSWSPVSRCGEGVVRRPARRVHRPPEGGFRGTLVDAPGAASLCWRRQALQPCPPPQVAFNAYFAVFRAVSNFGDDFTVRLRAVLLTKLR